MSVDAVTSVLVMPGVNKNNPVYSALSELNTIAQVDSIPESDSDIHTIIADAGHSFSRRPQDLSMTS